MSPHPSRLLCKQLLMMTRTRTTVVVVVKRGAAKLPPATCALVAQQVHCMVTCIACWRHRRGRLQKSLSNGSYSTLRV